jgi:hypothetical protein
LRHQVPAVMTVSYHINEPRVDGAALVISGGLRMIVELWRADRLSGVLEMGPAGWVTGVGVKAQPGVHDADLLLGTPRDMLASEQRWLRLLGGDCGCLRG